MDGVTSQGWKARGDRGAATYVRMFGASVLAFTFAVTTDSPEPMSDARDSDKTATTADVQHQIAGPFAAATSVESPTLEPAAACRTFGLDWYKLEEVPRGLFDAPLGSRLACSYDELMDLNSRNYVVKYLVAIPLPENGRSVVLRMQSNQAAPTPGPLDLEYQRTNPFVDNGTVSLETTLSGWGRQTSVVTLMYRYDTRRSPQAGASVNFVLPDVVAFLSASLRHEIKVDAELGNEERLALAVWGRLPGAGAMSSAKLTGTVGLRRQAGLTKARWDESYTLDWGASVQLSERCSAGLNMNYSWNDKGLGMSFFMEMKDPPRRLRSIMGGLYEPGNP
jgi:hypothetical protein